MTDPVDFVVERVSYQGQEFDRVRLDRLTDGRVSCCLCFEFFKREDLHRDDDGTLWDICQPCWEWEASNPARSER